VFIVCRIMTNVGHGVCLAVLESGIDSKLKLGKVGSDWLVTMLGNYQCALWLCERPYKWRSRSWNMYEEH
jgi:hypothetical protein